MFRQVPNKEWGRKARKQEDGLRNLNGRDRSLAIAEAMVERDDWKRHMTERERLFGWFVVQQAKLDRVRVGQALANMLPSSVMERIVGTVHDPFHTEDMREYDVDVWVALYLTFDEKGNASIRPELGSLG